MQEVRKKQQKNVQVRDVSQSTSDLMVKPSLLCPRSEKMIAFCYKNLTLMFCCDIRYYCSKACQLDDWPTHKQHHKTLNTNALIDLATIGNWKGVERLLRAGADPLATDNEGMSALDHASCMGYFKIVTMLLDSIVLSSKAIMSIKQCIFLASQEGHFYVVELLVKEGGKTLLFGDDSSPVHFSLLHEAAMEGNLELVKLLVKKGGEALLFQKAREVGTCLHLACAEGHLEVVKYLVREGGQTLLLQRAERSVSHATGRTCLHSAAISGDLDLFKFLVHAGGAALLHMEDDAGTTCLHVAAHNSRRAIVQFLLAEAGADFARRPIRAGQLAGKTALDLARGAGYVGTTCSCCAPLSTQRAVCRDLLEAELWAAPGPGSPDSSRRDTVLERRDAPF
jgi:ankyrin repeat protein